MDNLHTDDCRYEDEDLLLYAYLNLIDDRFCLVSAHEISVFDKYYEYAKNDDKDVIIDFEKNNDKSYQIVYGAVLKRSEIPIENLKKNLVNGKNRSLIDMDSEKDGYILASAYKDIKLYEERANGELIPFAALMQTHHVLHNEEVSITLFPYCGGLVFEEMLNKPFLLACRESVMYDDPSIEKWKDYISEKTLMDAYKVADLYIPREQEVNDFGK